MSVSGFYKGPTRNFKRKTHYDRSRQNEFKSSNGQSPEIEYLQESEIVPLS
ncbi:hypothetical protein LEP1GSC125_0912 [Leptospira mayottensis 200901122]|uniref:Uncharacterized protein n=1 Tax=Leptospira mayottensis 200901122 TaxID=1193010 RepID=A0AA87MQU0_9LEPT|nr:hypothetical protein LEP1GSC125_0912 [Leptospira mayottensis 200901122]